MKKLFFAVFAAGIALSLSAQDADVAAEPQSERSERSNLSAVWPACVGFCQWPRTPDLVGLRLTVPFSSSQENVTGFDIGFWGVSDYFEGIQVNVLRNNVRDSASAFQVGIYNTVARGDLLGVQVGLWNESMSHRGIQFGAINVSGDSQGVQIGIINRSETMYGFQVGLINIIRDAEFQFMPILNVGF